MDDYVACGVTDPLVNFGIIENGIDEMKQLTIKSMLQGVTDFKDGFKGLMTDYQTCVADTKDAATLARVVAYLKTFPDIDSFEAHVKKDIFWNTVNITKETVALKSA
jgi:hypothetical protein